MLDNPNLLNLQDLVNLCLKKDLLNFRNLANQKKTSNFKINSSD